MARRARSCRGAGAGQGLFEEMEQDKVHGIVMEKGKVHGKGQIKEQEQIKENRGWQGGK